MSREEFVARTFVEIADAPATDFDFEHLLGLLSVRSVETLHVTSSSVMMAFDRALAVRAWSDAMTRGLALFELRYDEGPSLECFRAGRAVLNCALAPAETRWPRLGRAGRAAGYQMVHALPLRRRDEVIGALVLYQAGRQPLAAADAVLGQALADATTIALVQQRAALDAGILTDQLHRALSSRVVVEQAKGIVAARSGLTVEAAFVRLRSYARSHNERLDGLARRIVDGHLATGALGPERPVAAVPAPPPVRRQAAAV